MGGFVPAEAYGVGQGVLDFGFFSSKTKGLGEQGPVGYCPKILPKRAKLVLCPFPMSHREICARNRFLRRNFWMISALSLPAPLVYCRIFVLLKCVMRWGANLGGLGWGTRLRGRTLQGGVLGTFWKPPSQNPF